MDIKEMNIKEMNIKKIKTTVSTTRTVFQSPQKEIKHRVVSQKWTFPEEYFQYEKQLQTIDNILNNHFISLPDDEISKITCQQINNKISNYKQQDILKKRFDESQFLSFESVIHKMKECNLICRYCNIEMNVLYSITRQMQQWSVDRIDNDKGHNIDNFHLACLACNLHRRRRTDEKFLFTKQLKIVKS